MYKVQPPIRAGRANQDHTTTLYYQRYGTTVSTISMVVLKSHKTPMCETPVEQALEILPQASLSVITMLWSRSTYHKQGRLHIDNLVLGDTITNYSSQKTSTFSLSSVTRLQVHRGRWGSLSFLVATCSYFPQEVQNHFDQKMLSRKSPGRNLKKSMMM